MLCAQEYVVYLGSLHNNKSIHVQHVCCCELAPCRYTTISLKCHILALTHFLDLWPIVTNQQQLSQLWNTAMSSYLSRFLPHQSLSMHVLPYINMNMGHLTKCFATYQNISSASLVSPLYITLCRTGHTKLNH